jgi:hypothetical protein
VERRGERRGRSEETCERASGWERPTRGRTPVIYHYRKINHVPRSADPTDKLGRSSSRVLRPPIPRPMVERACPEIMRPAISAGPGLDMAHVNSTCAASLGVPPTVARGPGAPPTVTRGPRASPEDGAGSGCRVGQRRPHSCMVLLRRRSAGKALLLGGSMGLVGLSGWRCTVTTESPY